MDRRADEDLHAMGHRNGQAGMWLLLLLVVSASAGASWFEDQFVVLERAPGFTLTSTGYENGTQSEPVEFSLSDYEGQVVVLDMMAVTCLSCRTVTERVLKPLHEEHAGPDFAILSIDTWADPETDQAFGETREELIKLQREEGVPWRHALDSDGVWRKYSAVALPQVYVLGPQQQIVAHFSGVPSLAQVDAAVERAFEAEADTGSVPVLQLGLLGSALVVGVASFFAPCSIGLIPAYMGFLLQGTQQADRATQLRRTLHAGIATGAGIVSLYGAIALLFWLLDRAGLGEVARGYVPQIGIAMGILLVAFGLTMLWPGAWDRIAKRMGMGRVDGRRGFFAFGVGYALAAFGCTGPILMPVLLAAFLQSPAMGLAVFAVYALALVAFVLVAAGLVASGQQGRLRRMLQKTATITRVSAALLVAAGAYLIWFDLRALGHL